MQMAPSIYSLSLDHFRKYDFSRPLFVQASRQPHFDEVVDLLVHRLALDAERVTLLTGPEYAQRPWMRYRHIVHSGPRLSDQTIAFITSRDPEPFSLAVLTTNAPLRDTFVAVRDHSNLLAFGHAFEPVQTVVVSASGHTASFREFFKVTNWQLGGTRLVGHFSMLDEEVVGLYEAALARPEGQVVEVGRFSGGSALILATAGRRIGRPGVYSVDIDALESAEYFFDVNGLASDIVRLSGDSAAVAREWGQRSDPRIALLFIDADHQYHAVARDLQYWTPFLVEGATVALHDMHFSDLGVDRAVYYHLMNTPAFDDFRQVGTTLICRRTSTVLASEGEARRAA